MAARTENTNDEEEEEAELEYNSDLEHERFA
jgi:hypothetical protein